MHTHGPDIGAQSAACFLLHEDVLFEAEGGSESKMRQEVVDAVGHLICW